MNGESAKKHSVGLGPGPALQKRNTNSIQNPLAGSALSGTAVPLNRQPLCAGNGNSSLGISKLPSKINRVQYEPSDCYDSKRPNVSAVLSDDRVYQTISNGLVEGPSANLE